MPDSWLYSRDDAAIRIVRTGALSLEVCGPGAEHESHAFGDEMEVVEFLRHTSDRLSEAGFRPVGFGADRRTREERRDHRRGPDRRDGPASRIGPT
jgi:hypothetical protein